MSEKQYIVTLKDIKDKEVFCEEMENSLSIAADIPKRKCECTNKRPISRNTHYLLTTEEANLLKNDKRVLGVEEIDPTMVPKPQGWRSSEKREGLMGMEEELKEDISAQYTGDYFSYLKNLKNGENIDIVIADGNVNPNHPEFSVKIDGTGGSRMNQINWFQYGGTGVYSYLPYDSTNSTRTDENNHGMHVCGIATGNRQGWAKKSNIYNINIYTSDVVTILDYVRNWHKQKPINPVTGKRNPTVLNNSWGFQRENVPYTNVTRVSYRDTVYNAPTGGFFSPTFLQSVGLILKTNGNLTDLPVFNTAMNSDLIDCINDGIIVVSAAGNTSLKIDIPGGNDYNNYLDITINNATQRIFYHRGGTPCSVPNMIVVGALSTNGYKATYSATGPGVTLYAAGSEIISSIHYSSSLSSSAVADARSCGGKPCPRATSYYMDKYSGTSMAAPQVAGILASFLQDQNFTQVTAKNYLTTSSSTTFPFTSGGYTDYSSLQGGQNIKTYYPYTYFLDMN